MRKPVLYVLTAAVAVFYVGVAGAAAAPYYGAVTDFVHSATAAIKMPHLPSLAPAVQQTATGQTTIDGVHQAGPGATASATSLPTDTPTPTAHQRLTAKVQRLAATSSTRLPRHRINILVLGSDNDAKFDPNAVPPTQVVIVLSIDPVSRTITLLSIPRDSWVHIPGYTYNQGVGPDGSTGSGFNKIMVASSLGFYSTACTVERNFGIPIDNYVWVGLQGFIKVIDSMNGVTVDVTHPVLDDTYPDDLNPNDPYAYRRIYIPPGPQHLNGSTALLFVRSRHGDLQSDFSRSQRQQILIQQVRRALLSQDAASLVALVPSLLQDLQGNIKTDISPSLGTAAYYWSLLRSAAHYTLTQIVLSPPYSDETYWVADSDPSIEKLNNGQPAQTDAVKLHWDLVNAKIQSVFGPPDYSAPHCAGIPGAQ